MGWGADGSKGGEKLAFAPPLEGWLLLFGCMLFLPECLCKHSLPSVSECTNTLPCVITGKCVSAVGVCWGNDGWWVCSRCLSTGQNVHRVVCAVQVRCNFTGRVLPGGLGFLVNSHAHRVAVCSAGILWPGWSGAPGGSSHLVHHMARSHP